jgi:hypothetical protein
VLWTTYESFDQRKETKKQRILCCCFGDSCRLAPQEQTTQNFTMLGYFILGLLLGVHCWCFSYSSSTCFIVSVLQIDQIWSSMDEGSKQTLRSLWWCSCHASLLRTSTYATWVQIILLGWILRSDRLHNCHTLCSACSDRFASTCFIPLYCAWHDMEEGLK